MTTDSRRGDPLEYRFASGISRHAFSDMRDFERGLASAVAFYAESIGREADASRILDEARVLNARGADLLTFISTYSHGDEIIAHYPGGIERYPIPDYS